MLSAILSSKNLLRLRSSNAYLILITSLVAADGAASGLLGVIIVLDFDMSFFNFDFFSSKKFGIANILRYGAEGFGKSPHGLYESFFLNVNVCKIA